MDKATIRAEAVKVLKSQSLYSFSEDALTAAVESGIPEGAVIMSQDALTVVRMGANAIGRDGSGKIVKTIPLAGDFADKAAIMYAVRMARRGSGTGIKA